MCSNNMTIMPRICFGKNHGGHSAVYLDLRGIFYLTEKVSEIFDTYFSTERERVEEYFHPLRHS